MSEAKVCPHCGAPLPVEGTSVVPEPDSGDEHEFSSTSGDGEDELLPVTLLASGSSDDGFADPSLGQQLVTTSEPDPILGAYVSKSSGHAGEPGAFGPPEAAPDASGVLFPAINFDAPAAPPPRGQALHRVRGRPRRRTRRASGLLGPRPPGQLRKRHHVGTRLDLDERSHERRGRFGREYRGRRPDRLAPPVGSLEEGRASRTDLRRAFRDPGQAAPGRLAGSHPPRSQSRGCHAPTGQRLRESQEAGRRQEGPGPRTQAQEHLERHHLRPARSGPISASAARIWSTPTSRRPIGSGSTRIRWPSRASGRSTARTSAS